MIQATFPDTAYRLMVLGRRRSRVWRCLVRE